ncbi:MAG TPA: CHAD domain-containing protein [Chthoniobacteraceae bacterium]|jgi:CHAD domain-containing protein|nr:CHAD domain-containing protein [Chthoniobacteraceae bacterium]
MAFRFQRRESVLEGCLRIVNEQVATITGILREECAEGPSAADIHRARTCLKRLRALLRLVRGEIARKVFTAAEGTFRDTGKRLAPARSTAVLVSTLDRITAKCDLVGKGEIERVRVVLVAAAQRSRRTTLTAERRLALATKLEETVARLERVRFANSGWEALREGVRRTYRQGRKASEELRDAPETSGLHAWRRRVKDLWYDLLLLSRLPVDGLPEATEQARMLSELLGEDHDLTMLAAELRRRPARFGKGGPPLRLHRAIADGRKRLLRQIFRLSRRLYAPRPHTVLSDLHHGWEKWRG